MADLTYSVAEAAQALGVSKSEVYNLVHREDFPAFQLAGKWRIAKVSLAAWVEREASRSTRNLQLGQQGIRIAAPGSSQPGAAG